MSLSTKVTDDFGEFMSGGGGAQPASASDDFGDFVTAAPSSAPPAPVA